MFPCSFYIFWQRGGKFHFLTGDGMTENKAAGMKRLSADSFHIRVVKVISDKGETEIFHMDSDLMGSTCFQTKGNKAEPVFFFQNLIVGNGAFSVFKIYHTLNDRAGLSGEGSGDGALFRYDMSPHKQRYSR